MNVSSAFLIIAAIAAALAFAGCAANQDITQPNPTDSASANQGGTPSDQGGAVQAGNPNQQSYGSGIMDANTSGDNVTDDNADYTVNTTDDIGSDVNSSQDDFGNW